MKNIKLLVSVFKSTAEQYDNVIFPVSAGAELYDQNEKSLTLRDDTGINISEKNPDFCELSVQYWAWKNIECDVCGIFHQRRYLDLSDKTPLAYDSFHKPKLAYRIFDSPDENTMNKICISYENVSALTNKYKVISALRENIYESVESYYNRNDRQKFDDIGLLREIILEKYPEYSSSADKYFKGTYSYFCNIFVMDKKIFNDYSSWLFNILFEYEKRKPKNLFYPREMGKLGERLFGVYMTHIINETNITWAEFPRAHFADINGTTIKNLSFDRRLYYICPPGSRRRAFLRKLKK